MAYQKALAHVINCSEAGLLPARLDHEGMEQALALLQQNLGTPHLTKPARTGAEPKATDTRTGTAERPSLSKDPRCVALVEALKPALQATCPEGAGGYGGALQANLHPADAQILGGVELIRAAMRRAARQLGWRAQTVGRAGEHLAVVIVQDIREAPAEYADALEEDHQRVGREMVQRMSAAADEQALNASGPSPVERQTEAFLQAARSARAANLEAWS
ncbi:hypothetical protein ABZX77_45060 [Streptomyces sp. NPDC004237]|uniref:hypothetical protein n=1 Tax=Streptomyces sp. NPDC004237 TaxID=3154455 RepID=UPI0033AB79DC